MSSVSVAVEDPNSVFAKYEAGTKKRGRTFGFHRKAGSTASGIRAICVFLLTGGKNPGLAVIEGVRKKMVANFTLHKG